MKLKDSGSISDSEKLNFLEGEESESDETLETGPRIRETEMKLPAPAQFGSPSPQELEDMTKVTIFPSSPFSPIRPDPANHDKIYYDDRYNESVFDPSLARSTLPKISISIGGMLLTGLFLNNIIVMLFWFKLSLFRHCFMVYFFCRRGMCSRIFPSYSF